ncbi:threonine aldolase family protein [Oceanobacillus jeddahense]|uniref:Aminotransferase class I/II-fold pyridoxal phosphate-dependent enzyme n=1 Tax=Oceanobacillus jeddahense TaxID=1462527 RepID=A0ABY5JV04_9BACI|nr:GntG family PLP-dependent aldolase [Oceanobacillus jeddahense]UUI04188.1 aminotransferase class I/II-fold pyridoxal phosphate-dependent enzyme [Oceanobacillus jeddahense]
MLNKVVDLRSDTVTRPTREMLNTIMDAQLGDDILGEDQTVQELERKAAQLLGKEDALLLTSGTMANQVAIMTFCERGDEIIMGRDSHIYTLEGAATSVVAQVQIRTIGVTGGQYDLAELKESINSGDIQRPPTSLICLENTYNLNAGQVIPLNHMKEIRKIADKHEIPIYLDGARVFNAAVELGVSPAEVCEEADAVQFCMTKGLACPVGSILAGSGDFIKKARLNKQRLGGGMRQAGIIAAPGIYALEHMVDRLKKDNDNAKWLAKEISKLKLFELEPEDFPTNIVSPEIRHDEVTSENLIDYLQTKGIKVKNIGKKKVRMIVHYEVTKNDLAKVVDAFHKFSEQY